MKLLRTLLLFIAVFVTPAAFAQSPPIHHQLRVTLDPADHRLEVSDTLSFAAGEVLIFYLNSALRLETVPDQVTPITAQRTAAVPVKAYRITPSPGQTSIELNYAGTIHHEPKGASQESARSFGETAGVISEQGVFLAGSSVWYPHVEGRYVSFEMEVSLPEGWRAVSQGAPLQAVGRDGWRETHAQEEIYLIAARFHEYAKAAGAVQALAYLREDDPALANRYLDVTAQYLEMYRQLIGPYPYAKFALVENFWETGYGMPSFTLLGPKVIRLPFILHSSYPHEILHNWWGNSVYVDYGQGNWAEGLTSYLADHLIQEQRGAAVNFRRNILQNYADFVSAGRDFALTEFTSRHSSSSEAVGYGKAQMLFHMLRRDLGDEAFVRGLHRFYSQFRFEEAGFADWEKVLQPLTDTDLEPVFQQWVQRSGAPALRVEQVRAVQQSDAWQLQGALVQAQAGSAYRLSVPVAVTLADHARALQTEIEIRDKRTPFALELPARPLRLDVDPEFDLFRRVSRAEIPPALSQAFGAERVLLVLPSQAPADMEQAYASLARAWGRFQFSDAERVYDDQIEALPEDRTVWLLGASNRFAGEVVDALADRGVRRDGERLNINGQQYDLSQASLVLTARRRPEAAQALVWLSADQAAAVPGLARKLPHYRKYSYLVFDGEAPDNRVKGQWPVLHSPMSVDLAGPQVETAALAPRTALAQLPAVFDSARMLQDVQALAGAEMEGRGLGSEGLDSAARYIARGFEAAGLAPGLADSGSYLQTWRQQVPGLDREITLSNVIGRIPGRNPQLASVVVGAHYDHLGRGWPDVREGNAGKLHPGADDNASGVAVMLELARLLGSGTQPERSIVFVAFTGEEANRLGSRHFVAHYDPLAASRAMAMVNLDTVGRLGEAPVTAFGTGSAREWVHIFRGIGFVSGIQVKGVAEDFGASDQRSFLDRGVPAVQLFGSVHPDFHTPEDVIEKVDAAGLVKVATVLKETVDYLANRTMPLSVTLPERGAGTVDGGEGGNTSPDEGGRKVSLGTVPDFQFPGPGVRLDGVVPDSPAARAGLQAGDVLLAVDQQAIEDLRHLAGLLRAMVPGQQITLSYGRGGQERQVSLALERR